jgi:hypothetical protein
MLTACWSADLTMTKSDRSWIESDSNVSNDCRRLSKPISSVLCVR